jgi:putative flippase GtrA
MSAPGKTRDRALLLKQVLKFGLVGILNTLIDFLVLNIEMYLTGITSGRYIFVLNTISFLCATINSYFMNKLWTFSDREKAGQARKFTQFLLVSIVGIGINGTIVYLITTHTDPLFSINPQVWANGAKIVATAASLTWNFLAYKLWVFKARSPAG